MYNTGVKLFMVSKAPCMLCFEICTLEGRKGREECKYRNKPDRTFDPAIRSLVVLKGSGLWLKELFNWYVKKEPGPPRSPSMNTRPDDKVVSVL